jgi:hypothetical protein
MELRENQKKTKKAQAAKNLLANGVDAGTAAKSLGLIVEKILILSRDILYYDEGNGG